MHHGRLIVLGLSAALTVVATPLIAGSSSASARSATVGVVHQVTIAGNGNYGPGNGDAIEGLAHLTYKCNDATGKFTAKLKGMSVIAADHITPFDTTFASNPGYWVAIGVTDSTGDHYDTRILNVTQDATTGLFDLTTHGVLSDAAACATGSTVRVGSYTSNSGRLSTEPYSNAGILS